MVAFLLEQRGVETADATSPPTPARIGEATHAEPISKAFPAPKQINSSARETNLPYLAIQIFLVSLVFLLSLFRLLKQSD
jgi:hypothetical protein